MTITEDIFQHFCSTSASPIGYGMLEYVSRHVSASMGILQAMVGTTVFESIGDLEDIAEATPLQTAAYAFVCCNAFYEAIPQLDLTLSPSGFGVVSNANVAPASLDRVERLRRAIKRSADNAREDVADCLRGNADWMDTPMAKQWFSTLFFRARILALCGYSDPTREDLSACRAKISQAERMLRNLISPGLFDEITTALRHNIFSLDMASVHDACVKFVAACVGGVEREINSARLSLISCLDDNIGWLDTYRESSAYKANHFTPYANKKDDPCYFFG